MPNKIQFIYDSTNWNHRIEYILDDGKRTGVNKLPVNITFEDMVRMVRNYTNPRSAEVSIVIL